jgi:hypothetical protein
MADDGDGRPLETGWWPDTPVGDTVLRRFQVNQARVNEMIAGAAGGRVERTDDVSLVDAGNPVPYYNQALLMRPLAGADDPVLDLVEAFEADGPRGRAFTLLSPWPTADLHARGWVLAGHPAFVVRPDGRSAHTPPDDVEIRRATTPDDLATVERVAIEGYPIDEAAGRPIGSVLPSGLVDQPLVFRTGSLAGVPVAAAASLVSDGVVNLCFAATLPAARRRGVWESLVWARTADAPDLPAVAFTSDFSRPGFERMGFVPVLRFTLWLRTG